MLSCHPVIPYLKSLSVIVVLLMSRLPFRFSGIAKEARNEHSKPSSMFHLGGISPNLQIMKELFQNDTPRTDKLLKFLKEDSQILSGQPCCQP